MYRLNCDPLHKCFPLTTPYSHTIHYLSPPKKYRHIHITLWFLPDSLILENIFKFSLCDGTYSFFLFTDKQKVIPSLCYSPAVRLGSFSICGFN